MDITTVVKHVAADMTMIHITYFTAPFQCFLTPAQIGNMLDLFFLKHKGNKCISLERYRPTRFMQFILEDHANVIMQQIAAQALRVGIVTAEDYESYEPHFKRRKFTITDPIDNDYIIIDVETAVL